MTKRRHLPTIALLLSTAAAGCGSASEAPPDGQGQGPGDGAALPDAAPDGADAGGDAAFVPPPETRRLVSGRAALVGTGPNSCTNQPGATADRWCGFVRPSATAGRYELWVFDATSASASADLACDGTDARCLRLSADALFSDFAGATGHGFQGDTLFYRAADGASPADLIAGPVWAWRPGWTAGRELVSGAASACSGPTGPAVALCLRQVTDAKTGDVSEELTAGPLAAGASGPLPLAGTVLVRTAADPASAIDDLETGFSPDGRYLGWSSRGELYVAELGAPGTRALVATDVSSWRISADETAWLWLRAYQDDGLEPAGTLETAQFPTGAAVTTLAPAVADYDLVGARGVLYRAAVADQVGDLRLMPDRAAPSATTLLDQSVRSVIARSADARTVVYTDATTAVGDELYASSPARADACMLTSIPSAFRLANLMARDQVVVWADRDVISQATTGQVTALATCDTTTFGHDLARTLTLGDARVLFIDDAPSGALAGTLRVAPVSVVGVGASTPLQRDVDLVFAPLAPQAVVYTVSAGTAVDGLYVYAGPLLRDQ